MKSNESRRRRSRWRALTTAAGLALLLPGAGLAQEPPPGAGEGSPDDDPLERELAEELEALHPSGRAEPRRAEGSSWGSTAASRGLTNTFNPSISANALVLGGWSSRDDDAHGEQGAGEGDPHGHGGGTEELETGLHLQEVEVRLSAIVDPYFRADLTLSAHEDEIAFEEAFVTTLSLPRVTLRGGQMYAAFGRHNGLHTHAFPFLTAPLPWRALLGPEGLLDPGVAADVLLPLPFYTELSLQAFAGEWRPFEGERGDDPATAEDESAPDAREREDLVFVGRLETVLALGDSATLGVGASYGGGRNGFDGWTHVVGADLTVKWRPIEAERYTGVEWTTEYLLVDRGEAPEDGRVGGAYTSLRYQFGQTWWVQGRGAVLGLPEGEEGRTWRGEALAAWVPSELSALRLQYAYETPEAGEDHPIHEVFLQMVFSIGSHPAHAY
jgi:hypothetical protein